MEIFKIEAHSGYRTADLLVDFFVKVMLKRFLQKMTI